MADDKIGTWKVAATRIEASLLIQPGWEVRLVEGKSGEAIHFDRTSVDYIDRWTAADGTATGLIGTAAFSPKVVRDDFLALKSAQEALAFFGKYGPFTFAKVWNNRYGPNSLDLYEEEMGAPPEWALAKLPETQAYFREMLLNPPPSWLPRDRKKMGISEYNRDYYWFLALGPLPLKQPQPGRPPYDTMTACCVWEALVTAQFLDVYTQERYRECEHCKKPFLVEPEHKRFCDSVCGSKARVARSRARARAAKAASTAGR